MNVIMKWKRQIFMNRKGYVCLDAKTRYHISKLPSRKNKYQLFRNEFGYIGNFPTLKGAKEIAAIIEKKEKGW